MRRVRLDKIGSATFRSGIGRDVYLGDEIVSEEGYVLAGRILNDKRVYNELENSEGRMVPLKSGDCVAGVLGHRNALHGYEGRLPGEVKTGDRIHLLNLGGVMGLCTSFNLDVGRPFEVEVMGAVLHFPYLEKRVGVPAHIGLEAIPDNLKIRKIPPIVAVVGTCMNSGKTVAVCEVIHGLVKKGMRVSAAKVTGVALRRDVLRMIDFGASEALSFADAGVVATGPETATAVTCRLISNLSRGKPDVLVVEFGDGIFGDYGVQTVLNDNEIRQWLRCVVLCANDPAGAWGACRFLKQNGIETQVVSGPVTDNHVGRSFIESRLGLKAANARTDPESLIESVHKEISFHAAT